MAAIVGNNNIVQTLRVMATPYWNIYASQSKREAGNVVRSWQNNLGKEDEGALETSLSELSMALATLAPGRYILTAFKKSTDKRGGVDTEIEVMSMPGSDAAVSGFSKPGSFQHEAVGLVTSENFREVIQYEINKIAEKQKIEAKITALEEENKRLREAAADGDGLVERGIKAIGTIVWPHIQNTPQAKEMIAAIAGNFFAAKRGAPVRRNAQPVDNTTPAANSGDAESRLGAALEVLAEDNDDLVTQLEALAHLKKNDPETFNDGISFIQSSASNEPDAE